MFEPTIAEQFTGSGRPTLLRAHGSAGAAAGVAEGVPIGRAYVVEEAFRWQAYTPDLAIVVGSWSWSWSWPGRGGATVRISTRMQMVWRDEGWRVVAPVRR
ncbi:hypothetical protein [Microbispora rosea]|uniref:hypothetical protein n=1 Tax=Microbispora rosea TaxID=58117 RepID=UPI00341436A6